MVLSGHLFWLQLPSLGSHCRTRLYLKVQIFPQAFRYFATARKGLSPLVIKWTLIALLQLLDYGSVSGLFEKRLELFLARREIALFRAVAVFRNILIIFTLVRKFAFLGPNHVSFGFWQSIIILRIQI